MAKVFIASEPRNPDSTSYDVGPAAMFGEVQVIFDNGGPCPGSNIK